MDKDVAHRVTDTSSCREHPRFFIDLEGDLKQWSHSTITPAQIRQLAGWSGEQQLVLIDQLTNEETSLPESAVVELLPGKSGYHAR